MGFFFFFLMAKHIYFLSFREEERVIHRYRNGFSGFAARLSEEEAKSIAERPGVVSVFPDLILKLQTTRSWDFISQMDRQTKGLNPISNPSSHGADTIIGIFDSGKHHHHQYLYKKIKT